MVSFLRVFVLEDNTSEDNTSEDNTSEDNTSEDNTSEDNTSEEPEQMRTSFENRRRFFCSPAKLHEA